MLSDIEQVFGFLAVRERVINMARLRELKERLPGLRPRTLGELLIDEELLTAERAQKLLRTVQDYGTKCRRCGGTAYSLTRDDGRECPACAGQSGPARLTEMLSQDFMSRYARTPPAGADDEAPLVSRALVEERRVDLSELSGPPLVDQALDLEPEDPGPLTLPPVAGPPLTTTPVSQIRMPPPKEPITRPWARKGRKPLTTDLPLTYRDRILELGGGQGSASDGGATESMPAASPAPIHSPPPDTGSPPPLEGSLSSLGQSTDSESSAVPFPGAPDGVWRISQRNVIDRTMVARMARPPALLLPGDSFSRRLDYDWGSEVRQYTVVANLGEGFMGSVVEVELSIDQRPMDRRLALKTSLQQHPCQDFSLAREAQLKQLPAEARKYAIQVGEVGVGRHRNQEFPFVVTEHLRPNPLQFLRQKAVIGPNEGVDPRTALEIFVNLLEGLGQLHRLGWVHGDIKPDNIMLRMPDSRPNHEVYDYVRHLLQGQWEPVLIDWGSAWPMDSGPNAILGTNRYLAPEITQQGRCGPEMDVYGLGLVLYELLTGDPPFGTAAIRDLKDVEEYHRGARSPVDRVRLKNFPGERFFPELRKPQPDRSIVEETVRHLSSLVNLACAQLPEDRCSISRLLTIAQVFGLEEEEIQIHGKTRHRLFAQNKIPRLNLKKNPYLNPTIDTTNIDLTPPDE